MFCFFVVGHTVRDDAVRDTIFGVISCSNLEFFNKVPYLILLMPGQKQSRSFLLRICFYACLFVARHISHAV